SEREETENGLCNTDTMNIRMTAWRGFYEEYFVLWNYVCTFVYIRRRMCGCVGRPEVWNLEKLREI
ncbi:MAG: hypothetical protein OSJ36_01595, partial [Odoribacter sp.]|nr:hypothetical protein [Odoribacter sp.]